jgi:acyl-CoA thioester hydrolase
MKAPPEPHLLRPESYPFRLPIETQFSDMDLYGHVNNLAVGRFYESARARFQMQVFDHRNFFTRDATYSMMLVEVTMRYLAECNFPDPVEVGVGVSRIGNSSYVMQQALFQKGACVGLCEAVMVLTTRGKPTHIPADTRERMTPMLLRR